jgi:hypothetical protein
MSMPEYDNLLDEARRKAEAYRSTANKYIPRMFYALRREDANLTPQDARDRIEKDCIGLHWSKRTILEALPDEAKDPKKQESGRLGQKKRNSAAASAAPNKNKIIIDTTGQTISDFPPSPEVQHQSGSGLENKPKFKVSSKPKNCPGCKELFAENVELKEALSKTTALTTASEMEEDKKINELQETLKEKDTRENELIAENQRLTTQLEQHSRMIPPEIVFSIDYRQLQRYMASQYKLRVANIWITMRLDTSTGEVISVVLGRESNPATSPQSAII